VAVPGSAGPMGETIVPRSAGPSSGVTVCVSLHRHGMSGRWSRASPKGVPIGGIFGGGACWHEDATWLARHGAGGVWLPGYRPVVGKGAGAAIHGAGRQPVSLPPSGTRMTGTDTACRAAAAAVSQPLH